MHGVNNIKILTLRIFSFGDTNENLNSLWSTTN